MKGRIIHEHASGRGDQIELYSEDEGAFEVVAVDGVFLASKKSVIENVPFDEKTFTGFHFYDIDLSLRVAQKYKVLVTTDILLKHYSPGDPGKEWNAYRQLFIQKHKKILPFTNQKKTPDWKNIKHWMWKKIEYIKSFTHRYN